MSIIKSIKQVLGLGPAAENHFWDGSVANQLTLKRGTPDAPGTTILYSKNGGIAGLTFANPTVQAPDANTLNCYRFTGQLTGSTGVSSETGALGTYSWSARYLRLGRKVMLDMKIDITNAGTGSGALIISPVACGFPSSWSSSQVAIGSGRRSSDGAMLQAVISNSTIILLKYDNTTAILASSLSFSIAYDTNDL